SVCSPEHGTQFWRRPTMFWDVLFKARQANQRRFAPRSRGHSLATTVRLRLEELEPRLTPANPPTLTFAAISGAVTYDVWVSDLTTGASPIARNTNVTVTSWTVFRPLNPDDTYEWWVRGISATGVRGPWSDGIVFTVTSLPAPALLSPVA